MSIVVFLHGRGRGLGPETAESVASAFQGTRLLAPTGGLPLRRGQTWFENIETGIARPESAAAAERRLLDWLDRELPDLQRCWLAGFSNGGALAAHMLIHHPKRFHGGALFAAPLVLPPWPAGALKGQRVFYAHGGEGDRIVGQTFYRQASAYLTERSGAQVTVRHYDVDHQIAPAMVDDCRRWFADARERAERAA